MAINKQINYFFIVHPLIILKLNKTEKNAIAKAMVSGCQYDNKLWSFGAKSPNLNRTMTRSISTLCFYSVVCIYMVISYVCCVM